MLSLLFKLFTTKRIITIRWSKYLRFALVEVCCWYLSVSLICLVFRRSRRDCFSFPNRVAAFSVAVDVLVVVAADAGVPVPVVVAVAGTFVFLFVADSVAVAVAVVVAVAVAVVGVVLAAADILSRSPNASMSNLFSFHNASDSLRVRPFRLPYHLS